VWEGKGYFHKSDVWALGVTLFNSFKSDVFRLDLAGSHYLEDIAVGKLKMLFPCWTSLPGRGKNIWGRSLTDIFESAQNNIMPAILASPELAPLHEPLNCQLADMDIAEEWKAFLQLLLCTDPKKRLSATEILRSPEYHAVRMLAWSIKET
jgi:serine/threonine protein kinase